MTDERIFYVDPKNIKDNSFILDESESVHAINVLRLRINDRIILIDGLGKSYFGKIVLIKSKSVEGTIQQVIDKFGESKINLNIVPSILKRNRL